MRLRYAVVTLLAAAVIAFAVEPALLPSPPIAELAQSDRADLYSQVIIVTAGLLGFFVTAVSILVSLDARRKIVEELQRGESLRLLVANMLATVALLFALTLTGIVASVAEADASASRMFERFYEWLVLATILELTLSGVYFGSLTYKVASNKT